MSRSSSPRLAIVLPTYRYDAAARQALSLAAQIGCDDIHVHIGDNSENPDKHAFLHDLAKNAANVSVTCHPKNVGAEANWLFLVRAQTAPFICLACDDDSFTRGYFTAGADLLACDIGCSAASGLLLSVAEEPGQDTPMLYTPPERLEADPLTRIARYSNQNAIAYAVTRREAIAGFADYVEQNPLKNAFNDYLLAFHLLSMGTYRLDRRGQVYVYDNDNWHLPEAALKTSAKFYVGCGLPQGFAHLARLHWAVANAHFFRSRFRASSLSSAMAGRIAAALYERLMKDFRGEFRKNKDALNALFAGQPAAKQALSDLVARHLTSDPGIFDQFGRIIAAFSPEIAERYVRFVNTTLTGTDAPPTPRRGLRRLLGR